ncbi:hypothetical protein NQ315_003543 [Exocentrus adspersus]|uniref:MADF domain-containing protein n=1 Tax=Exocentrus adspersus TaxID=1586481 RepID=A0AAV8VD79_9CUCU|nr:hypothetical protein NQ315_003543 [Exocentrus adspersus]
MEWTNELIYEFINLYENEPALWNTKSLSHKNRNEQHDSWNRIKEKLKDSIGDITIKELKKKRDNLMSTYRKLRSKINSTHINREQLIGFAKTASDIDAPWEEFRLKPVPMCVKFCKCKSFYKLKRMLLPCSLLAISSSQRLIPKFYDKFQTFRVDADFLGIMRRGTVMLEKYVSSTREGNIIQEVVFNLTKNI